MKKILTLLMILLIALPVYGAKIADLKLKGNLVDTEGNLTAGALSRVSAATYIKDGLLQTAWGNRTQLINTTAQNDITTWWTLSKCAASVAGGIVADTDNDAHRVTKTSLGTAGTYIFSMELKAGAVNWAFLQLYDNTTFARANFNLLSGVLGTQSNAVASIVDVGDGWYRCSILVTTTAAVTAYIYAAEADGDTTFAGDNVSVSTYVRNIMLEVLPSGNVVGSDLFDQETLGTEIITASDDRLFTTWGSVNWAGYSGGAVSDGTGKLTVTMDSSGNCGTSLDDAYMGSLTVGTVYKVQADVWRGTTTATQMRFYLDGTVYDDYPDVRTITTTQTTYTWYVIARETDPDFYIYLLNSDSGTFFVDNVTIKPVTAPAKGIPTSDPWPALAGAEAITLQNDRDFSSETKGNWTVNTIGSGTCEYDAGPAGEKTIKLVSDTDDTLHAKIGSPTSVVLTTNTLFRVKFRVYVPAANALKKVQINHSGLTGSIMYGLWDNNTILTDDTWTWVEDFYFMAADVAGYLVLGFSGNPADGDVMYIDDITVMPVKFSWIPYGTNKIGIDPVEDAFHIKYVDTVTGAYLSFANAADLTSDLTVGETYLLQFDAKCGAGDSFNVTVESTPDVSTGDITSSWVTYKLVFIADHATQVPIYMQSMGAGDELWIRNISIKVVPDFPLLSPSNFINSATIPAKPRFESNGLLIEGESTNLLDYSEDFTQWVATNVLNSSAYSVTDPTGTVNTECALIADATADEGRSRYYTLSMVLTDSTTYTGSLFVKAGTVDWVRLHFEDKAGTDRVAYFHLDGAGTVGTETNIIDSGISYVGGGWYRVWIAATSGTGTTAPYFRVYAAEADGDAIFQASVNDVVLYIYGAQFEQKPYPTSYIPTSSCPVTRTTEAGSASSGYSWTIGQVIKNAISDAEPVGSPTPSKGTLVVEWTADQDYDAEDTGGRGLVSWYNAITSVMYFYSAEGQVGTYDGTNQRVRTVDWLRGEKMVFVIEWDDSKDGGAGYVKINVSQNGVWDLDTPTAAYDGAYAFTSLYLCFSNELPIHINRIVIYDDYMASESIQDDVWNKKNSEFPMFDIWEYGREKEVKYE